MNHRTEYIAIWQGTSLGQGDSSCSNEVPGVTNDHTLRGHSFI